MLSKSFLHYEILVIWEHFFGDIMRGTSANFAVEKESVCMCC